MSIRKLNTPLTFRNGITIPNRVMMAPMTSKAASWEGYIEEEDLAFFGHRSKAASILVTGATAVSKFGEKFPFQMSLYDDSFIPGMSQLAERMKRHGNKALVQIYHSGLRSAVSMEKHGKVYGPSSVKFAEVPYEITELTEAEVWEVVHMFGAATKRAWLAGFDGVEIHGAYSHLIQQFFSPYSNKRTDFFGGTLKKRMNFALAIVDEVQRVARECWGESYIVGYRLTEEKRHKNGDGYGIKETLQLIDALADKELDYIQVCDNSFNESIYNTINGRTVFITVPHTFSAGETQQELEFADMVSLARACLIETEFASKINEGRECEIITAITSTEMAESLQWPHRMIEWLLDPNGSEEVPDGIEYFEPLLETSPN
ncbi:hypothetical protein ABR157_001439 [Enterobacter soli]|uniref:oxidoreductase n=1 Tax=Enterobacter soli TaxID=885040 RepID=UPI0028567A16|nr:hypothetical protein [Enterobacter soli]MDR7942416.1 hypothetical protein [Enterobacter soli]